MQLTPNKHNLQFLKNLFLFSHWLDHDLKSLCPSFRSSYFSLNNKIYSEGDQANFLYFISQGSVMLLKKNQKRLQQLAILNPGEIFGEELLLNYPHRQFTALSLSQKVEVLYISKDDLDENLWDPKSRQDLYTNIYQKWSHRVNALQFDIDLKNHLTFLKQLLLPEEIDQSIDFKLQLKQYQEPEKLEEKRAVSNILSEMHRAKFLINQKKSKAHVTSNLRFGLKFKVKSPLDDQLNEYLSLQSSAYYDENLEWGDDGTRSDRKSKISNYYTSMEHYCGWTCKHNDDLVEGESKKAQILDVEYRQMKKQKVWKVFQQGHQQGLSDNQIRQQYFLKQLKKMQKRLKVLQLIKKGILKCQENEEVNEDGEIVKKRVNNWVEEKSDQPFSFNFITSAELQREREREKEAKNRMKEEKLGEVDQEIRDVRGRIEVIRKHAEKDGKESEKIAKLKREVRLNLEKVKGRDDKNICLVGSSRAARASVVSTAERSGNSSRMRKEFRFQ